MMLSGSQNSAENNLNPLKNLLASIFAFVKRPNNSLKALNSIVGQPKDEHGNIWIGVDSSDFTLWKNVLEHFIPKKIFGPILIPTDPKVINKLLSELKLGERTHFNGNRSTDVIGELVGHENIFAATDSNVHSQHKTQFKNFIHDYKENVTKVNPVIENWIQTQLQSKNIINEDDLERLSSQIMLSFLLDPESANDPNLIQAVINLKSHFIKNATFQEMQMFGYLNGYEEAKTLLSEAIAHLYGVSGYPHELAAEDYTIPQTTSHILSLLMVGFANLQSGLTSLLIKLSEHPEYREDLRNEIQPVDGIDFVQFDLAMHPQNKTFSQKFFRETLRLAPPVWLQARKNTGQDDVIYHNEKGEEKSFCLPSATLVLIPNYQLARKMQDGNEFLPDREMKDFALPLPFSTGPNACPGRNIAYAACGVLIAKLINNDLNLSLGSKPKINPSVALTWKNVELKREV